MSCDGTEKKTKTYLGKNIFVYHFPRLFMRSEIGLVGKIKIFDSLLFPREIGKKTSDFKSLETNWAPIKQIGFT